MRRVRAAPCRGAARRRARRRARGSRGRSRDPQRRRPRRERRWQRDGAVDGAGARVRRERHRVRRHACVHDRGRRRAGAGRCRRSTRRRRRRRRSRIQAWFNNDIVGGSQGGDGIIDSATVRVYSEGPEDSPSRALAIFAARIGGAVRAVTSARLMARRDRFSRGGDHSALNAHGFAAIGFRESRENYSKQHGPTTRLTASTSATSRRTPGPTPRGWRRSRSRRRRRSWPTRAARRPSTAVRPATTRTCAGKPRRAPRLSRLLAQGVGARLGARGRRRQRHRVSRSRT